MTFMVSVQKFTGPLAALLILAVTIISLSRAGISSRSSLPGRTIYTVSKDEDALELWKRLGLRGRVLVYFGKGGSIEDDFYQSLNLRFGVMERIAPPAGSRNFLILALYSNIFRKVYHVVPDSRWSGAEEKLSSYPFMAYNGRQFRYTIEGIPIIVTRLKYLPSSSEKAVLYIESPNMTDKDYSEANAFIKDPAFSDIVVLRRNSDKSGRES